MASPDLSGLTDDDLIARIREHADEALMELVQQLYTRTVLRDRAGLALYMAMHRHLDTFGEKIGLAGLVNDAQER